MKTDFYTKTVLTIIALSLVSLTLQHADIFPKAYANTLETTPTLGSIDKTYGLVPLNEDGSITVRISESSELDVNLISIDTSDELDVNIDEVGGGYVSYGGPIYVEID